MVQLRATQDALHKLGVETEFSDQPFYTPALAVQLFDIVHTFNFSMKWNKYQTWVAKKHKRPLVCSMIYHEGEQFVPYADQQIMADNTDAMIFLTEGEIERVKRHIKIDDRKCHVIPNGVHDHWFRQVQKIRTGGPYVLTVGRVESSKGQLDVAQACNNLGVRYVMVGERTDEEYTRACESLGAEHMPPMKPDQLIRMYASCSVFALASRAEVMPLSAMEAMAQGANVVLTAACEWRTRNVVRCMPGDVESIQDAIQSVILAPKNTLAIEEMRSMSWDSVGQKLLKIYQDLCVTL